MSQTPTTALITFALPYGNGELHIGHILEALLADAQAKALRALGTEAFTLSATDSHGAPISLSASAAGIPEEAQAQRFHARQAAALERFGLFPSHFGSTLSEACERVCLEAFAAASSRGLVFEGSRPIPYDSDGRALFERAIVGACPRCGREGARGLEACECGALNEAEELLGARSAISGATPSWLPTRTLSFGDAASLRRSGESVLDRFPPETANQIRGWLSDPRPLEITRPLPYFGFRVPGEDLAFAVWWDAPLAYLGLVAEAGELLGRDLLSELRGGEARLIHWIGKDIARFHALYWPLQLEALGCPPPERFHVHGFVCDAQRRKLSKSQGNAPDPLALADALGEEAVKLYLASIAPESSEDAPFSEALCRELWNRLIVGKWANAAFRCSALLERRFAGALPDLSEPWPFLLASREKTAQALRLIADGNIRAGFRLWAETLSDIDALLSREKPWERADAASHRLLGSCLLALEEGNRVLAIFAPALAAGFLAIRSAGGVRKPPSHLASRL